MFAKGLGVGDELPVLGPPARRSRSTISGVFEPPPRTDPFFFGEDSPFSIDEGPVQGSSGPPPPVVTTRSTALDVSRRLGLSTSFSWDLYLPWDRMTWEQAQGLETVQHTIDERLVETLTTGRAHVEGGIPELIGDVRRSVEDLQTPVFLVALQILLVGLAVIAGVGVLLAARQGFELAILHSRGFSRSWLFRVQLLQAGVAAVVALPIGLLFARGLAAFAGSTTGERAPGIGFPTDAVDGVGPAGGRGGRRRGDRARPALDRRGAAHDHRRAAPRLAGGSARCSRGSRSNWSCCPSGSWPWCSYGRPQHRPS